MDYGTGLDNDKQRLYDGMHWVWHGIKGVMKLIYNNDDTLSGISKAIQYNLNKGKASNYASVVGIKSCSGVVKSWVS